MAGAVQAFNPESTFVINDSTVSTGFAPSFRARVADSPSGLDHLSQQQCGINTEVFDCSFDLVHTLSNYRVVMLQLQKVPQ